ncbi:hypothetical protein HZC53_01135 [Candidatus Uhrbacteria bacterium]|nr:hypothetical protein [Candidatus Uhrbacteria bacterium]
MQTNGRKEVILVAESTERPPVEDIYRQVDELGEGWRIISAVTTSETVNGKAPISGRIYRRFIMTAVVGRS